VVAPENGADDAGQTMPVLMLTTVTGTVSVHAGPGSGRDWTDRERNDAATGGR